MKKTDHYNVIKVIALLLVVFAHSSRMYAGIGVLTPYKTSEMLKIITKIIYAFHMPLFVGVSGMVYGFCVKDCGKYHDVFGFLKKKFIRLGIPYLFWGLCYVAPIMCLLHFTDMSYFKYCFFGIILSKNPRHLWYITVLLEIFVFCAIFNKIKNLHYVSLTE